MFTSNFLVPGHTAKKKIPNWWPHSQEQLCCLQDQSRGRHGYPAAAGGDNETAYALTCSVLIEVNSKPDSFRAFYLKRSCNTLPYFLLVFYKVADPIANLL
jgi:hypothetical protein